MPSAAELLANPMYGRTPSTRPFGILGNIPGSQTNFTFNSGSYGGGLSGSYDRAMAEAKAANEARYQRILGGYDDLLSQAKTELAGLGSQGAADINTAYAGQASQVGQQLVNSGLYGTTVLPTMQMGVERERLAAQNRLAEQVAQQRLSVLGDLGQQRLNFMERRTDEYPDTNQLISLSQGAGQYGSSGVQYVANPVQGNVGGFGTHRFASQPTVSTKTATPARQVASYPSVSVRRSSASARPKATVAKKSAAAKKPAAAKKSGYGQILYDGRWIDTAGNRAYYY